MAKVLYHQEPQSVILDLRPHKIDANEKEGIKAWQGNALFDAGGTPVVLDPKPGTAYGQYTIDGEDSKPKAK